MASQQPASGGMGVERQLDQLVERLSIQEQTPATRALLIEARRLRSMIANWRSVPPSASVREEMIARVLHISAAAGDSLPPSRRPPASTYGSDPRGVRPGGAFAQPLNTTGLNFDQIAAMNQQNGAGASDRAAPTSVTGVAHGGGGFSSEETVIADGLANLPSTPLDVHQVKLAEEISGHLVMLTDPTGQRADAYRALRHRLTHSGDPRVIGVTSAGRKEGKSTAAINLAASLREGARGRVLLVEANTRAPSISAMLGFEPPVCFAEQLTRHRAQPLEPWVAAEPLAPLHVMAVNPKVKHSPLIDPIAFSIAIDRLRLAGYDYIVVDTSPVLESADVNLIADSMDGILMTVLARKSDSKSLRRAMNQLGAMTFIGTIFLE
ncbi:MAG: CpsD/CapB family tyrosine-protein kinase [Polyangiaceae bacterium]